MMQTVELLQEAFQLVEQKKYASARDVLLRAIRLDPSSPDAHSELALCYGNLQEHAKAREHLERATQLEPQNPKYWTNLAMSHFLEIMGAKTPAEGVPHLRRAEAAVGKALETDPLYASARKAWKMIAKLLRRAGEQPAFQLPSAFEPDYLWNNPILSRHRIAEAAIHMQRGDPDGALHLLIRAAIAAPSSEEARSLLATHVRLMRDHPGLPDPGLRASAMLPHGPITEKWARGKHMGNLIALACGLALVLCAPLGEHLSL